MQIDDRAPASVPRAPHAGAEPPVTPLARALTDVQLWVPLAVLGFGVALLYVLQ